MNTAILLMAQYGTQVVIPVDKLVRDYFSHLSTDKFIRKVEIGEIKIPLLRIESGSQKAAKGVHLDDLAAYIDARQAAAVKEARQMAGAWMTIAPYANLSTYIQWHWPIRTCPLSHFSAATK